MFWVGTPHFLQMISYDSDPLVPTSPRSRSAEVAWVALPVRCTCKHGCLKLYCQCRQKGVACDPSTCSCKKCTNTAAGEAAPLPDRCTCKRTHCLKMYCVCLAQGKTCGPACECRECRNREDCTPPPAKRRRLRTARPGRRLPFSI